MKGKIFAALVFLAFVVGASFLMVPKTSAQSNRPFVPSIGVTLKKVYTNQETGGPVQVMRVALWAMRGDGATIEADKIPNSKSEVEWPTRDLTFPAEAKIVRLVIPSRTKMTLQFAPSKAAEFVEQGRRKREGKCLLLRPEAEKQIKSVTEEQMGMFRTFKIVGEDSTYRFTRWNAPEYNCLEVKSQTEFLDAGGRVIRTATLSVVSVVFGEPDPSLFQIPDQFAEISPAETK